MKKLLIALLIGTGVFLNPTVVFTTPASNTVYAQEVNLNFGEVANEREITGTADYDPDAEDAGFGSFISRILNIIVIIAALVLFLMLIWGGMEWITSGGDKGKVEKARNRITQSIIGMIVLAGVVALYALMQQFLGFELLNFTGGSGNPNPTSTPTPLPTIPPNRPQPV